MSPLKRTSIRAAAKGSENKEAWLLETTDYREFIRRSLVFVGGVERRVNFAGLSRKAGFTSRSFPRDVVAGKRRITPASLPRFVRGLQLRGDWKNYFELLVGLAEPDTLSSTASPASILESIEVLRKRLKRKTVPTDKAHRLFRLYYRWLDIFAALGSLEKGSSLQQVISRTKLTPSQAQTILGQMVQEGVVRVFDDKYYATQSHLSFAELGSDRFVKDYYRESLREVARWVESDFGSSQHLFSASVISMNSKNSAKFKLELRELIQRFAERVEDPEGDCIAKIVVGFGSV